MPNDHAIEKEKIENKFGTKNVLWGDEVSDIGIFAAGLAAYYGRYEGYEYFASKINNFKDFGLDAIKFLSVRGNPKNYILYFSNINIDHWESNINPFTGDEVRTYIKRSYRYYMGIKKKSSATRTIHRKEIEERIQELKCIISDDTYNCLSNALLAFNDDLISEIEYERAIINCMAQKLSPSDSNIIGFIMGFIAGID